MKSIKTSVKYLSEYQEKYKAKTRKEEVDQGLKIGDFVFIRKHLGKHKARELHVIHGCEKVGNTKYFIVRKAGNQLRLKVYKMLQQELVKAPIRNEVIYDVENEDY